MRVYANNDRMTSGKIQAFRLTPRAQQLYDALAKVGNWVNRTELAKLTGKAALNKWDLVLINKLVESGVVEIKQIPRHGLINYEWQYRALNADEEIR